MLVDDMKPLPRASHCEHGIELTHRTRGLNRIGHKRKLNAEPHLAQRRAHTDPYVTETVSQRQPPDRADPKLHGVRQCSAKRL